MVYDAVIAPCPGSATPGRTGAPDDRRMPRVPTTRDRDSVSKNTKKRVKRTLALAVPVLAMGTAVGSPAAPAAAVSNTASKAPVLEQKVSYHCYTFAVPN